MSKSDPNQNQTTQSATSFPSDAPARASASAASTTNFALGKRKRSVSADGDGEPAGIAATSLLSLAALSKLDALCQELGPVKQDFKNTQPPSFAPDTFIALHSVGADVANFAAASAEVVNDPAAYADVNKVLENGFNPPVGLFEKIAERPNAMSEAKATEDWLKKNNFQFAKASSKGDCFFDSLRQEIIRLHPEKGLQFPTAGALRKYLVAEAAKPSIQAQAPWFKESVERDLARVKGATYADYLSQVGFTAYERKAEGKESLWGRYDVEGRLLCKLLKVSLHVMQIRFARNQPLLEHFLITGDGEVTVPEEKSIDGVNKNKALAHMAVYEDSLHYVPFCYGAVATAVEGDVKLATLNPGAMLAPLSTGAAIGTFQQVKTTQSQSENAAADPHTGFIARNEEDDIEEQKKLLAMYAAQASLSKTNSVSKVSAAAAAAADINTESWGPPVPSGPAIGNVVQLRADLKTDSVPDFDNATIPKTEVEEQQMLLAICAAAKAAMVRSDDQKASAIIVAGKVPTLLKLPTRSAVADVRALTEEEQLELALQMSRDLASG